FHAAIRAEDLRRGLAGGRRFDTRLWRKRLDIFVIHRRPSLANPRKTGCARQLGLGQDQDQNQNQKMHHEDTKDTKKSESNEACVYFAFSS
ncbi:MAG TPA: hypothetical protein VLB69_01835, partial [Rudaea sp.]|nr:hypothetical protein [Rudaea sp.]